MKFSKPRDVRSGFHADVPEPAAPEVMHVGEQWAPRQYAITRHAHPVWEFYLQLDGVSIWKDAAGRSYRCGPGAFFAAPPGLEHWLARVSRQGHHFYYAAIDIHAVTNARLPTLGTIWRGRRSCIHAAQGRSAEPAFRQLVREVSLQRSLRAPAIRVAADALIIEATRLLQADPADASPRSLVADHLGVQRVRELLEQHYGEEWRLADLGRIAGLSPNHLLHRFSSTFGLPPHQFLIRLRIDRARDLLRNTDAPITRIAMELGFGSSQHFSNTFKTATRQTPSAYRAKGRHRHSLPG
jgi:AraC-like DNA-binding protein